MTFRILVRTLVTLPKGSFIFLIPLELHLHFVSHGVFMLKKRSGLADGYSLHSKVSPSLILYAFGHSFILV